MLVFRLGSTSSIFNQNITVHAAVLVTSVPVTFSVLVTLISTIVATAVAAELTLVRRGSIIGEPSTVSGVGTIVDGSVRRADRAADIINIIPNTFTSSVGLVVTVGRRSVSVTSRTALARASEFENKITEQVTFSHILSVECQDRAGSDLVASTRSTRETVGELGPVQNIGRVGVEVGTATRRSRARLESTLDGVVGGALRLGVAREESELNVDITLASRNRLVELLDVTASPVGTKIINSYIVSTEHTNINTTVEERSPDAVTRSVVVTSKVGVVVTLLRTAFVLGPVPITVLVSITVGLKFILVLALSRAESSIRIPLAASEVEARILGSEDFTTFVTFLGGSFPSTGVISITLGLDGVITALTSTVTLRFVLRVEDPAAAFIIKTLASVEVAADLGHAVVTTIVPFTVNIRFALGFVVVVTRAKSTLSVADEGRLGLLDVAHRIRATVRVVVLFERAASTSTDLRISPLVPSTSFILRSSRFTERLCEVRVSTTTEALLVWSSSSIGLEFTSYITVTSRFVGTVSGADTSAAVVDTVPGTAVGIIRKRTDIATRLASVTKTTVFKTAGTIPVTLAVSAADSFGSVVT